MKDSYDAMIGRWKKPLKMVFFLQVLLALASCAPEVSESSANRIEPRLEEQALLSFDARPLAIRRWLPQGEVKAVILALHGFNDYSRAFERPAPWWASLGVATYAYDQRGFGHDAAAGLWNDPRALIFDVHVALRLLHARHPNVPVYLLGESMGSAVALTALAADPYPDADGLILVAPGVWGGDALPLSYRIVAWGMAHTVPWLQLTGRGLGIRASDNIEMLRELGRDPLFIKETRVDAVYGLVNLMGRGQVAAETLKLPTLVLYGTKDQVIPPKPVQAMINRMTEKPRVAVYDDGWHMLLRDLQGPIVWRDIASWILTPSRPLPSGSENWIESNFLK